ncbi:mannosyltransferase [Thoreauomyces humboldtii]|nr:mannosyltransferase [Thoreauomyces humboldtii]
MIATTLPLGILLALACAHAVLLFYLRFKQQSGKSTRVLVLVLGDIGRSPRTQYHAVSLAREGFHVHLVGYAGTPALPEVREAVSARKITLHHLPTPRKLPASGPRVVYLVRAVLRTLRQITQLMRVMLWDVPSPGHILVQNPPAVPTLLLAQYARLGLEARLVIDWHNFGFSIMALTLGSRSAIVRLAETYERLVGRYADAHICVSEAMGVCLKRDWRVRGKVVTLYDKSPEEFRKLDKHEVHELMSRYTFVGVEMRSSTSVSPSILTTCQSKGSVSYLPSRPALLVSSTSWTEDEDFGILLEALREYDAGYDDADGPLPDVVLVITGKGPLKQFYSDAFHALAMRHVRILTAWLPAEDYPLLLGAADLGISLHTSSSGLDLPMKIVDMFGCGLPVCAVDYPCLRELVVDRENGRAFSTPKELCAQLQELLRDFKGDMTTPGLAMLQKGTEAFASRRWHGEWKRLVQPLFPRR